MSRTFFGDWGAELDDVSFACAIAQLLTVAAVRRHAGTGATSTYLHPAADWWQASERYSARRAAQEWRRARAMRGPVAIGFSILELDPDLDPDWLVQTLKRAPGVRNVFLVEGVLTLGAEGSEPTVRKPTRRMRGGGRGEPRTRAMRGGQKFDRGQRRVQGEPLERDAEPPPEQGNADGRVLSARLREPGEHQALNDQVLKPEASYQLDVRIARPEAGWVMAPVPFPVHELPASAQGHQLEIVLMAVGVLEKPVRVLLLLPALDDSEPCSFLLRIPRGLSRLDARVTVLFKNRILQTVRITAPIAETQRDGDGLKVELESVLRASLIDLSKTEGFDVALLFNDSQGESGVTAFAGDAPAYVSLHGVEALRKALRAELESITREPRAFVDPTSNDTRVLFLTLARAGASFLTGLRELPGMKDALQALGHAGRLQVTSLHPDDLVPLELIYDGPFPNPKAVLCAALMNRQACDGQCVVSESVVCASHFWGVRHVIERRLFDEHAQVSLQQQGATHAFRAEAGFGGPGLPALRTVLLGSAQRAAAFDAPAFDQSTKEMEAMLSAAEARLVKVDGWEPWAMQVAAGAPQVLLLIVHTEPSLGAAVLELGQGDQLAAEEIKERHVSAPVPTPPHPGPVVLLFGCRTAEEEVPFSNFIGAFRRAHASVIVGTLSTVRGRHMAPVAKEALRLLLASSAARTSIGEVVRDLRRSLLAQALPIGLTLVAFGEADWQLGGGT